MNYDENNIFAKILREEIPCTKVYEDEQTLAFMDIMPQVPGHTLVIPKEPAETLFELSDEGAANLIQKVKVVASAVKKGMNADGITLFQLNGTGAGQTVPHIHFHVMPGSYTNATGHGKVSVSNDDIEEIAVKIRAAFKLSLIHI